jgi:hypothetical protein
VLGGIIAVAVVVAMIINAALGGRKDAPAVPQATGSTASPTTEVAAPDCAPEDLTVALVSAKQLFSVEEMPTFTATVTNEGSRACLLDASPSKTLLHITSGSDRIFDSGDCQNKEPAPPATDSLFVLKPQASHELSASWNKTRSNESCGEGLPAPVAGAKYTYWAEMTVMGAQSDRAPFSFE